MGWPFAAREFIKKGKTALSYPAHTAERCVDHMLAHAIGALVW